MKKKLLALAIVGALPLAGLLTACDMGPRIGILQPADHVALDAAREGFKQGLKENGISKFVVDYRNAKGNSADLTLLAKDLVDSSQLTLGIGTGAAQALKGASENAGNENPILFTAVTDPVVAGLVSSSANTTGYVCGTTDANPVNEQVALLKEFKPTATKLGIMYTQTEVNSQVQAQQAAAAAVAVGLSVSTETCTGPSDIGATALALVQSGVDAIYLPTDNNIASNMNAVKTAVASSGVLVICGEEGMLSGGGHVTLSIDYFELGRTTGAMAAAILKGEKKPTDYPVVPVAASDCEYVYSSLNLADAGLSMPEALLSAHNWRNVDA